MQQSNVSNFLQKYWQTIVQDAKGIDTQLQELEHFINTQEVQINHWVDASPKYINIETKPVLQTFLQSSIYHFLKNTTLDIQSVYNAYQQIDINNSASVKAFLKPLRNDLKQVLAPFIKNNTLLKNMLDKAEILLLEVLDFLTNSNTIKKDKPYEILIEKLKIISNKVIELLALIFNLDSTAQKYLKNVLNRSEVFGRILAKKETTEEKINSNASKALKYLEKIKPKIPDLEAELEKIKLPESISFNKVTFEEFLQFIYSILISKEGNLDINTIQTVFNFIKEKIKEGIAILKKDVQNNLELTKVLTWLEKHSAIWFTLPDNFKPENIVEIVHYVVKNIQFSSKEILFQIGNVGEMIYKNIHKLEVLLSKINNDDFTLILKDKRDESIKEINISDILKEDTFKNTEEVLKEKLENVKETPKDTEKVLAGNIENSEEIGLSISQLLKEICFNKKYGAVAVLNEEFKEIIVNLYYYDWLNTFYDKTAQPIAEKFKLDKENIEKKRKAIKNSLLKESGINLGEYLKTTIEKALTLLTEILTTTITVIKTIVKQLFDLIRAIIKLFREVKLPDAIIPKFIKDHLDGVNLFYILCAIPYTTVKEFIAFEVPEHA